MPKPNTNPRKTQIIAVLKQDYFPMIPQLQQNWTPEQHEKNRLSRSLAAFAIAQNMTLKGLGDRFKSR